MSKKYTLIAFIIVLGVGLLWWFQGAKQGAQSGSDITSFQECVDAGHSVMESYPRKCSTPDGRTFTEDIGNELAKSDMVRVNNPRPNTEVTSTIDVSGEAKGSWYFEGSFSMRVESGGEVVGEGVAQADGEWMTEDFVPFSGQISLTSSPASATGTLVLEKANPSGMPENADSLQFPIRFTN